MSHLSRSRLGKPGLAWVAAGLWLVLGSASAAQPSGALGPAEQRARGQALFEGRAELSGRIRGHDDPLPAEALRCINCHARVTQPVTAGSPARFGNSQAFGPVLDGAWLSGSRARRGAPPSAYDAGALCTALREGLDPQQVRMSRNMPLYEIRPSDCEALWAYLAHGAARP